eukprot:Gb_22432 [translate_table: standard]
MEDVNENSRESVAKWSRMMSKNLWKLSKESNEVCPKKEHVVNHILSHLATIFERLSQVLKEIQRDAETLDVHFTNLDMKQLENEVKDVESLFQDLRGKSLLYLLTCSAFLFEQVKNFTKKMGKFLGSVTLDGSSDALRFQVSELKQLLEQEIPKLDSSERRLCDSFEDGALDSIVSDPSLSNRLAERIADSLAMPLESEAFLSELAKLKAERANAESMRGKAHSLYLEQFIVLLEKAIASKRKPPAADSYEKVESTHGRHLILRDIPMLPLQSFICPITKDVMRDPVQIASGQTYERSAIERWFAEGHTRCPTGVELKNIKMKPNFALKQSIAEWRERNCNIRLENINELIINSESIDDRLKAVQDLQALCEVDSLNKYKVAKKNLIPPLIRFAKLNNELGIKAFSTLVVLAKENDENQGIMMENGIIDLIVRCLARQKEARPQAVILMRLLSENQDRAEKISQARNAVLFLVTLIQEEEFAENVSAILENLPKSDDDVVTMAKANIMEPLVSRLIEGEKSSQILMANTLGSLHLPETSKELVAKKESIHTLIEMMGEANEEECAAAINALINLSSVSSISKTIEYCNGIPILLKLLTAVKSSESIKIGAAHILSNMSSAIGDQWQEDAHSEAQLEQIVSTFLSLMGSITPPNVHYYLLQGLMKLANGKETSFTAKVKMNENNSLKLLISLWMAAGDQKVKRSAVQLFSCLSNSFGADACSALKEQTGSLNIILDMLKEGCTESDHVIAASILADLPVDDNQMMTLLLKANIIPQLVQLLENSNTVVVEACTGALLKFCLKEGFQQKLAELKVVQKMVSLLSSGRSLTKERAAKALSYFSKSTPGLSKRPDPPKCWACFSPRPVLCKLHLGICHVDSTYCLLEAEAVKPLVSILKEQQMSCVAAALDALSTLVDDKVGDWETGCRLIDQEKGFSSIIALISNGTPEIQEICANLCERFFNIVEYRKQYGTVAQMHIINLAQKGSGKVKHTAGKILRQLELLHSQSHYFASSATGNS